MWLFGRSPAHTVLFGAFAALGPFAWLLYNHYNYGNALEFYNGPYSSIALHQRSAAVVASPTYHNWSASVRYYFEAARLMSGMALLVAGAAGALVASFFRTTARSVLLLLIPPVFFVLSLHGGGSDLNVPTLWPHTVHNIRYGFVGFVFVASACSGLVTLLSRRKWIGSAVLVGAAVIPWFTIGPICWREARDASKTRRKVQNQAVAPLEANYRHISRNRNRTGMLRTNRPLPQTRRPPAAFAVVNGGRSLP